MDPFATLDLRSLRALHVLLETRSVTAAARRLKTSQPTMSRVLGDLRTLFGDPLLVQVGRRLEPTPRAMALLPDLASALSAVRALFEPAGSAAERPRQWHLAATDYAFVTVVRPWLARQALAPGETVHVHSIGLETVGAIERGDVHLALAPRVEARALLGLVVRPLARDGHTVVVRKGHPLAKGRLTLARYLAAPHVTVRTDLPGASRVDLALQRVGRAREVAYRVASLSQAIALVESTDAVGTLPSRFVRENPNIVRKPPPLSIEPIDLCVAFAPRYALDPAHRALREALAQGLRGEGGERG